ncbi:hypothetical protein DSECCO2_120230 [anaerobic digester metagenome]
MYEEFAAVYLKYTEEESDKVFRYVYEIADSRSYSNRRRLNELEQESYARDLSGLDSNFKVGNVIKKAITKYKALHYNSNQELLNELEGTLDLSFKINRQIKELLSKKLDDKVQDGDLVSLINLQNKLFDVINELPNKIEQLKQLRGKVNEDYVKPKQQARGEGEIPASYDGDPDIEGTI